MKRLILIEVDDEIVERKSNECGGCEELTGLCFLAAPKAWHERLEHGRPGHLTRTLADHGIIVLIDKEIVE